MVMTIAASSARLNKSETVKCVDLFCGVGGLTHGMVSVGLPVVAGVDLDEACHHPYEANNARAKFYARDVASLKSCEVQEWFGDAEIRVLAGCAPCQPFSTYAQRYETVGTERWGLLNHFARLVKETNPHVVTMENVPSVIKHEVFRDFVDVLKTLGYEVSVEVVDCSLYGLPQRRRRTVLLASKFGRIELSKPTEAKVQTVRDALKGLPPLRQGATSKSDPLHVAAGLTPLNLERIRASKPGGTWRDWPKRLIAKCHRKDSGKTYAGVYGRMKWDEPSPTLTTQFYGFGNGRFGHPSQSRAISLREGAILQGFPQDYSFVRDDEKISFSNLGRLIGNAVPVDLGKVIGQSILIHLESSAHVETRFQYPVET